MMSRGEDWSYTVRPGEPLPGVPAMVTIMHAGRLFAELHGATADLPAMLIGCSHTTVRKHASRLFGARRRPGARFRLTATQLEQLRQSIDANRRPRGVTPRRPPRRESCIAPGATRGPVRPDHRAERPRRDP